MTETEEVSTEDVDDDVEYHTLDFTQRMWAHVHTMPNLRGGSEIEPGYPATYGCVKEAGGEDYYVGISESSTRPMMGRDMGWGHFYPERVFVWGQDGNGDPLKRTLVREYLRTLGLRHDRGFWNPCQVWRGYNRGEITWHNALRADANIGIRWHDVWDKLKKLPDGWQWDPTYGDSGGCLLIPVRKKIEQPTE